MEAQNGVGRRGTWGILVVVLLVGVHLVRSGTAEWRTEHPPRPLAAAAPDHRTPATTAFGAVPGPLPASRPARVRVPAVGIDAPVVGVGLDTDGGIGTPPAREGNLAGWFTGAVTPGEKGTAVVVGHVDTPAGRGVFFGLGALGKGRRIEIARQDGRTAVFSVYGVEVVPQDGFPAERVYRAAAVPELRVLTCGGDFTEGRGYDGNLVVFARLTEVRRAADVPSGPRAAVRPSGRPTAPPPA
ncbi:class F sortase [Streptomyces sp. NBC_01216]|uniref:class F sortase n=1 Tax=unclassified Streptomyces TaxID=2593676 RepID=UPI002E103695|nr:class F sortase [Streptomyces sp. NBC_01216]